VLGLDQPYAGPMKNRNLIIAAVIAASLASSVAVRAAEENAQELKASDVPAAVQKAAENRAKGGKILRWEKEGANYEALVEKKSGKQVGIEISGDGKILGKHDQSKEQKAKQ
jgi:hypothetical protein